MSREKATLGFATRTEAVIALRRKQLTTREIAHMIGISTSTVAALEASAARQRKARPEADAGRAFIVPDDVYAGLCRAAARRHMSPSALARRIVEVVVDDNMIDAVLDDAGGVS